MRSKRGALSGESPFKQQHMITKRNAPPSPTTSLNHSTYCLGGTVNDLKSIPETVCVRVNASQRNVGCWTGTALGRYAIIIMSMKQVCVHVHVCVSECVHEWECGGGSDFETDESV